MGHYHAHVISLDAIPGEEVEGKYLGIYKYIAWHNGGCFSKFGINYNPPKLEVINDVLASALNYYFVSCTLNTVDVWYICKSGSFKVVHNAG